jgi:hypothetical protein
MLAAYLFMGHVAVWLMLAMGLPVGTVPGWVLSLMVDIMRGTWFVLWLLLGV